MLNDHGSRDAPAGIQHEIFQQPKFFRSQLNSLAGPFHSALDAINF